MTKISKRLVDYIFGFRNVLYVRNVSIGLNGGGLSIMTGRARVRTQVSKDAEIEEKIAGIQSDIDKIYLEIDEFRSSQESEIKKLQEEIERQAKEFKTESESLRSRFDVLLAENAEKEFFGALLFLIGILYSSASGEVARAFKALM